MKNNYKNQIYSQQELCKNDGLNGFKCEYTSSSLGIIDVENNSNDSSSSLGIIDVENNSNDSLNKRRKKQFDKKDRKQKNKEILCSEDEIQSIKMQFNKLSREQKQIPVEKIKEILEPSMQFNKLSREPQKKGQKNQSYKKGEKQKNKKILCSEDEIQSIKMQFNKLSREQKKIPIEKIKEILGPSLQNIIGNDCHGNRFLKDEVILDFLNNLNDIVKARNLAAKKLEELGVEFDIFLLVNQLFNRYGKRPLFTENYLLKYYELLANLDINSVNKLVISSSLRFYFYTYKEFLKLYPNKINEKNSKEEVSEKKISKVYTKSSSINKEILTNEHEIKDIKIKFKELNNTSITKIKEILGESLKKIIGNSCHGKKVLKNKVIVDFSNNLNDIVEVRNLAAKKLEELGVKFDISVLVNKFFNNFGANNLLTKNYLLRYYELLAKLDINSVNKLAISSSLKFYSYTYEEFRKITPIKITPIKITPIKITPIKIIPIRVIFSIEKVLRYKDIECNERNIGNDQNSGADEEGSNLSGEVNAIDG